LEKFRDRSAAEGGRRGAKRENNWRVAPKKSNAKRGKERTSETREIRLNSTCGKNQRETKKCPEGRRVGPPDVVKKKKK